MFSLIPLVSGTTAVVGYQLFRNEQVIPSEARSAYKNGEWERATFLLQDAHKVGTLSRSALDSYADSLIKVGDMSKAIEIYREINRRYPNDSGAKMALGGLLHARGELKEATAICSTLHKVALDNPQILISLAKL